MKNIKGMLLVLVIAITAAAQQPTGFNYQAVVRNSSGQVLANQNVVMRLSLTSPDGSITYYAESHSVSTNPFGLVTLVVGGGTVLSGSLTDVTWGTGQQSLKVEVSTNGGVLSLIWGANLSTLSPSPLTQIVQGCRTNRLKAPYRSTLTQQPGQAMLIVLT